VIRTDIDKALAQREAADLWRREAAKRYADRYAARRRALVEVNRQPQRQSALNPVSKKRQRENRERNAMLRSMFPEPENVMCVVPGCCNRADDPHEPLTRARGGSITDPTNIAPLCRPHHREITDTEPEWAYALGLLKHSWDVA
jgi:hypothetical protein